MIKRVIPAYWHKSKNFGDNIAPYLIEKITGLKAVYIPPDSDIEHVAMIGSLLDNQPLGNTTVWGCGFAHSDSLVYQPKEILAVRGKLSRQRYLINNIDCPEVYGDPALLLPTYFSPSVEKKYKVGIIPHVIDFHDVVWNYANRYKNYLIIDLSKSVEEVVQQILSCEKTISSSLHGLVVSHAYGIPSRWVEFSDRVIGCGFKFRDYFTTVKTEPEPLDIRTFPDLSNVADDIPDHKIIVDIKKLIDSCPL